MVNNVHNMRDTNDVTLSLGAKGKVGIKFFQVADGNSV